MKRNGALWGLMGILIFSTLFFWSIFSLNITKLLSFGDHNLLTVVANYDGPNYLVISKCWYDKDCIRSGFSLSLPLEYYPAHLPGYPLIIGIFNRFVTGPWALLLSTLSGSVLALWGFYRLALDIFKDKKKVFWLSVVFMFLPARYFVLRMVGAPETWFLASVLWSIYFFRKKKYLGSALWVVLAQLLKSPGLLLLVSLGLAWILDEKNRGEVKKKISELWPYVLVPVSVFFVFLVYKIQLGDFWAYFNSGDNIHLNPLPYLVFISTKSWLGTIWLEDVIYIFLLGMLALFGLKKKFWSKEKILFLFPLLYFVAGLLIAHRDMSRYLSPTYPFFILGFSKYLVRKEFKIVFFLVLPAVILYAVNFVVGNVAPIADWAPYL